MAAAGLFGHITIENICESQKRLLTGEIISDTAPMSPKAPIPLSPGKLALWLARALFALLFATFVGGLPIYIHQEIKDLRHMEQELGEIKKLNRRLFVDLEDSAVRLESLKSPRGVRRVLRERGYAPPGSVVFQIEPTVKTDKTAQN